MNMSNDSTSIRTPILAAALAMSTLALAGCATSGGASGYSGSGYGGSQTACYDCGTVVRIEEGNGSRTPNATGAVVGAVIGGLAAREIADNQTDSEGRKNTATVAGAAAGGVIGNASRIASARVTTSSCGCATVASASSRRTISTASPSVRASRSAMGARA